MRLKILLLLIFLSLLALSVSAKSDSDFNVERLSDNGKLAYEILFSAKAFRIGADGWGLSQSHNEIALRVLLQEKLAKEALTSIIHDASPEGSLYGLLGLKIKDLNTFNRELQYYKSKPEPPERLVDYTAQDSPKIEAGMILLFRGDFGMDTPIRRMIQLIERGEYDETFRANKRALDKEAQIKLLKTVKQKLS